MLTIITILLPVVLTCVMVLLLLVCMRVLLLLLRLHLFFPLLLLKLTLMSVLVDVAEVLDTGDFVLVAMVSTLNVLVILELLLKAIVAKPVQTFLLNCQTLLVQ